MRVIPTSDNSGEYRMCKESKENLGIVRKVIPTIDNSGKYRMCMESKEKFRLIKQKNMSILKIQKFCLFIPLPKL